MKTQQLNGTGSLAACAASLAMAVFFSLGTCSVQAFPPDAIGTANSCRTCHGTTVPPNAFGRSVAGMVDIVGLRSVDLPLGVDLDGNIRGPLGTFDAVPGQTVTVSMDITSLAGIGPNPRYALQLKRLETGGQKNATANRLGWTNANPVESGWVIHGANTVRPYFTKDVTSGEIGRFSFDLALSESTPVDLYDLEFAIAGTEGNLPLGSKPMFYADEHFYVAVVSPTLFTDTAVTWSAALTAAGYILESTTNVVTGPWQTYTGPSSVMEGGNVILMKTTQGPQKFFRLRKL